MGRDGVEVGLGVVAMRRKGEETVCGERSRKQVTWALFAVTSGGEGKAAPNSQGP